MGHPVAVPFVGNYTEEKIKKAMQILKEDFAGFDAQLIIMDVVPWMLPYYEANGEYAIVTGKNKKSYNMLYRVNGKWQDFKVPKWEEKNIKYVKDMDAKDYSLLSKIKKSDFPDIYDRIIVVGAVDRDKKRSSYSNCNLSSENGMCKVCGKPKKKAAFDEEETLKSMQRKS